MASHNMIVEPLTEEDGGGYMAYFPDLPGCMSDGQTEAEARRNAMDALAAWTEVQTERGVICEYPHSGS